MNENTTATAALYLDLRRKKKDDTYPVKIRITYERETKFYPLKIDLTEDDFKYIQTESKPKKLKDIAIQLRGQLSKAEIIIGQLHNFSFDAFGKAFINPLKRKNNILDVYDEYIALLYEEDRVGTAQSYEISKKSFLTFVQEHNPKKDDLQFRELTPNFFMAFERWMLKKGNSINTVGIYTRAMRAIINYSINEKNEFPKELYPFGKGRQKYQIPSVQNVKRALKKDELGAIFNFTIENDPNMEKARDFWFFSYQCNGINTRDIANLKYSNLSEKAITFIRNKTRRATKGKQKNIIAPRTNYLDKVILLYGNKPALPDTYVFPVFKEGMTEMQKVNATRDFFTFINHNMARLLKLVGIDKPVTTYWARHSYATVAIQNGAHIAFISDSLGHADVKTTEIYIGSFEESVKKDFADKLMDFD